VVPAFFNGPFRPDASTRKPNPCHFGSHISLWQPIRSPGCANTLQSPLPRASRFGTTLALSPLTLR
jgi:hypothetical protein